MQLLLEDHDEAPQEFVDEKSMKPFEKQWSKY